MTMRNAEVAEQADALRSGRSGLYAHVGSTPTFGIRKCRLRSSSRSFFFAHRQLYL